MKKHHVSDARPSSPTPHAPPPSSSPQTRWSWSTESVYMDAREERLAAWTHALGIPLGLMVVAVAMGGKLPGELFLAAMALGISTMLLYFCSMMSHAVFDPVKRNRWRAFDQAAIYLMIVATYTPYACRALHGTEQSLFLMILWVLGLSGAVMKVVLQHRINAISTVSYLLLGWLPAIPLAPLTPAPLLGWMALGGILYTAGVPFLLGSHHRPLAHTLWHLFVLAGTFAHLYPILTLSILAPDG
ncbi:MAG: hemolysin III [Pirellulaceae bacterium]|nr:MAG: hemolysin III [Pirellulaceae bacterium]